MAAIPDAIMRGIFGRNVQAVPTAGAALGASAFLFGLVRFVGIIRVIRPWVIYLVTRWTTEAGLRTQKPSNPGGSFSTESHLSTPHPDKCSAAVAVSGASNSSQISVR